MRSLSWKLAAALLLIVLVSVGLMAYLTGLSTQREFRDYVVQGNIMHERAVGSSLAIFYSRGQSWSGVQDILPGLLRSGGDRIIVADSGGNIVGDSDGATLGRTVAEAGIEGYGAPVIVRGQEVGSSFFLSSTGGMMGWGMMGGMMGGQTASVVTNSPESEFSRRVNLSLWIAGVAAASLALVIGIVLTRQITRPVRTLTTAARGIGRGDLTHRVPIQSRDEIGELAQSFNAMAASLEAGEQSRRRMTADIAHELRTPLTIIEGTVDAIMDGVFTPDRDRLASIKEQTDSLTRLVSDLRDLSLAESGQLKLDLAPEDIVEQVRRILPQFEAQTRQKGVRLALDAAGGTPSVKVDRNRFHQVISNLLNNAVQHTPADGSITVSISEHEDAAAGRGVLVAVRDTGEGIPPAHLPHIFERFYRASDSRARGEGGSGLGLAIAANLVQAHGGRIWAESQPGKGSTFFVFLRSS